MSSPNFPPELIVFGRASQKHIVLSSLTFSEQKMSLLSLLTQRGIQLASACKEQGVCQKCHLWHRGKKILACQHTFKTLIRVLNAQNDVCQIILEVDYL